MTGEEIKLRGVGKTNEGRGTGWPGTIFEAKKHIGSIASGDVMEILSADEGTKQDIPKWCGKQGHEYLGYVEENGYFKVYMKKK